jgi:hypothetical protein
MLDCTVALAAMSLFSDSRVENADSMPSFDIIRSWYAAMPRDDIALRLSRFVTQA